MQKVDVMTYSDKSIVVVIEPTETEKTIMQSGGMFAPILKRNGSYQAGYVLPKSKVDETKANELAVSLNYELENYSDKSYAMFGKLSDVTLEMIKAKGLYNKALTDSNGARFAGWIFSTKQADKVKTIIQSVTE